MRRAAIVFALAVAAMLADRQVLDAWDTRPTAALPWAIVRGRLTMRAGPEAPPYYWIKRGDRLVSRYPVATAVLATAPLAPFILAGVRPSRFTEEAAAAVLAAAMVAFLYAAMRRLTSERGAALACAVFVFGTGVVPLLGHSLWQHTGAALCFAVAAWALLSLHGNARAAVAGFAAGAAVACRHVDAILAAGFLLALAAEDRDWPKAFAAAALPVALAAAYNVAMFASPFATGYGAEAAGGWMRTWYDILEGETGILFSPARGLLVYSPVLLLAIAALLRPPDGVLCPRGLRVIGWTVLAYTAVMGCWWSWHGGFAPGPRMLSDALPFLALGLAAATRTLKTPLRRAAAAALVALSLAPNLVESYVPAPPRAVQLNWMRAQGTWAPESYPLAAWF